MKGKRKYTMHLMASWMNFITAIALILAAVILKAPDVLMSVIANGLAQSVITGGAMWANSQEHRHGKADV